MKVKKNKQHWKTKNFGWNPNLVENQSIFTTWWVSAYQFLKIFDLFFYQIKSFVTHLQKSWISRTQHQKTTKYWKISICILITNFNNLSQLFYKRSKCFLKLHHRCYRNSYTLHPFLPLAIFHFNFFSFFNINTKSASVICELPFTPVVCFFHLIFPPFFWQKDHS